MTAPRHLLLIDGSGFVHRAFHALPLLQRSDGMPVNAVLGFCRALAKYRTETDADHIAAVFDAGRNTFRHKVYKLYKANRGAMSLELAEQFPLAHDAARAFGISAVEKRGFEADDLIATYTRQAVAAGAAVTILTSDKDMMQLVSDANRVALRDPVTGRLIEEAQVVERFGVVPALVPDVQALCGDAADNVPGVMGIGAKAAAALINQFGSLDALYQRVAEVSRPKQRASLIDNESVARLALRLVTLHNEVGELPPLSALRVEPLDEEPLLAFLRRMEFGALERWVYQRHAA